MSEIIYRNLEKKDYEDMKFLIDDAFGFSKFIKDPKFLASMLNLYLQSCILDSSFAKLAVQNGNIIGLVLGDAQEDKNHLKKFHNVLSSLNSMSHLIFSSKENKKAIKTFMDIDKAYKEIIRGKKNDFQGCLQLFIVSKESRGLGVGKALLNHFLYYVKSFKVNSFYLYTDDRCNFGFYDSQGFIRIGEKNLSFEQFDMSLDVFLYKYDLS